jgi:acyl carrier protein
MSDPIAEELLRVIRKYADAGKRDAITLATPLEDTGLDSLGMAEAIFELEDTFKVSIPDAAGGGLVHSRCVRDLHAVLSGLVASR